MSSLEICPLRKTCRNLQLFYWLIVHWSVRSWPAIPCLILIDGDQFFQTSEGQGWWLTPSDEVAHLVGTKKLYRPKDEWRGLENDTHWGCWWENGHHCSRYLLMSKAYERLCHTLPQLHSTATMASASSHAGLDDLRGVNVRSGWQNWKEQWKKVCDFREPFP